MPPKSAHGLSKYCRITKYLEKEHPVLFEIMDDLCLLPFLKPKPQNKGVTFIIPTDNDIKNLSAMRFGSSIETAIDIVRAHIIHDVFPSHNSWSGRKDIPNDLGNNVKVKSVTSKGVLLDNGVEIALDPKFVPFTRIEKYNSVYRIISPKKTKTAVGGAKVKGSTVELNGIAPKDFTERAKFTENRKDFAPPRVKGGAADLNIKQIYARILPNITASYSEGNLGDLYGKFIGFLKKSDKLDEIFSRTGFLLPMGLFYSCREYLEEFINSRASCESVSQEELFELFEKYPMKPEYSRSSAIELDFFNECKNASVTNIPAEVIKGGMIDAFQSYGGCGCASGGSDGDSNFANSNIGVMDDEELSEDVKSAIGGYKPKRRSHGGCANTDEWVSHLKDAIREGKMVNLSEEEKTKLRELLDA